MFEQLMQDIEKNIFESQIIEAKKNTTDLIEVTKCNHFNMIAFDQN